MKVISVALQVIGALSLALGVAVIAWIYFPNSARLVGGTKNDAEFILNWSGINKEQSWSIINSSVSRRSATGDHVDYYCLQLEKFSVDDEITSEAWQTGPEQNPLLVEAIQSALGWAQDGGATCMPTFERANSENMKVFFWSTTIHDRRVTASQVILFEPSSNKLFYVSFKT